MQFIRTLFFSLVLFSAALSHARDCTGHLNGDELPPQVARFIESIRKWPHPAARQQLADFVELMSLLNAIKFEPLEMTLRRSDLPAETLELLRVTSSGIISIDEFMRRGWIDTYALGLSKMAGQYEVITQRKAMKDWQQAYIEFDIDWYRVVGHTRLFMEKLTSEDRPIVFFVPNLLRYFGGESITRNEFDWLLANPSRMKNVTFVFGAYDIVTPRMLALKKRIGLSEALWRVLLAEKLP